MAIQEDERSFYTIGEWMFGVYRLGARRFWVSYAMTREGIMLRGMDELIVDNFGNLVRARP